MAAINELIPKQNFEILRVQIGAILKRELENQKVLQNLPDEINVYDSRVVNFDIAEGLMFNISFDRFGFDDFTHFSSRGDCYFNITIFASAETQKGSPGDKLAAIKLNKYMGMVRYILASPKLYNLELDGLVKSKKVVSLDGFDEPKKENSSHVKIGVVSFMVNTIEDQCGYDGVTLVESVTEMFLDETELGYRFEYSIGNETEIPLG